MTISDPTLPSGIRIDACRYKSLALAVCRETGMTLDSALSLTPVEAYTALGAECYGR